MSLLYSLSSVSLSYSEWPVMKNLFDNLVSRGLCRPFIAVAPTWDRDNRAKDWDESTREAAVFHREYVADLIPAVEGRYATWAEATDEAGIAASRAHRALGDEERARALEAEAAALRASP